MSKIKTGLGITVLSSREERWVIREFKLGNIIGYDNDFGAVVKGEFGDQWLVDIRVGADDMQFYHIFPNIFSKMPVTDELEQFLKQ